MLMSWSINLLARFERHHTLAEQVRTLDADILLKTGASTSRRFTLLFELSAAFFQPSKARDGD
jgi:hypothetical protein